MEKRAAIFERCLAAMKLSKEGRVTEAEFRALASLKPIAEFKIDYGAFKSEEKQILSTGYTIPLSKAIISRRKELGLPPLAEVSPEDVKKIFEVASRKTVKGGG